MFYRFEVTKLFPLTERLYLASKMIDAQGKSKNRQECKVLSSQKKGEKVSKKEMENETLQATGILVFEIKVALFYKNQIQ